MLNIETNISVYILYKICLFATGIKLIINIKNPIIFTVNMISRINLYITIISPVNCILVRLHINVNVLYLRVH